jgi:hypothetical protein
MPAVPQPVLPAGPMTVGVRARRLCSRAWRRFVCGADVPPVWRDRFHTQQAKKVNQAEGLAGCAGEVRWKKVANDHSGTLADWNLLLCGIFCKIGELVGVDGVAKVKCDHESLRTYRIAC